MFEIKNRIRNFTREEIADFLIRFIEFDQNNPNLPLPHSLNIDLRDFTLWALADSKNQQLADEVLKSIKNHER